MTRSVANPDRLVVIDALRGVAALAVCWFHFTQGNPAFLPDGWLKSSGTYGWLGVDIFFVISGFVLPYAMNRNRYELGRDTGRFIIKRIVRLDPPYLTAALLSVALWYASSLLPGFRGVTPEVSTAALLAHVGYLNDLLGLPWLNPVFWSLAIEFQFYLAIAVLFPLVSSSSARVRLFALAGLGAAAFIGGPKALVMPYLGMFGCGIACFQYYQGHLTRWPFIAVLAAMASAVWVVLGAGPAIASGATAVVIAFVRPQWVWGQWVGTISYSLYLLHVPIGGRVINAGTRFADNALVHGAVLLGAFAASIGSAWIFYRVIERPAQSWAASLGARAQRQNPREASSPEPRSSHA